MVVLSSTEERSKPMLVPVPVPSKCGRGRSERMWGACQDCLQAVRLCGQPFDASGSQGRVVQPISAPTLEYLSII